MSIGAIAQERQHSELISVAFSIDTKPISCKKLQVTLRLDGRTIAPTIIGSGFIVPSVFINKKASEWDSGKRVDVSVSCGEYTLTFPQLYPTWVTPGSWELGIAHPPYWFEQFGSNPAIEHGTWLSYLEFECNGCDPGVVTTISHSTPLPSLVTSLLREQPSATGERSKDIAYALAVLGSKYQNNRDYLVGLLNACLSRQKQSAEDDVCDARLVDYVTNLYWRGDNELLVPLLQMADDRKDVIGEIGIFFGELLDRRSDAALQAMRLLPENRQRMVCKLAGQEDLSSDPPKFERITKRLEAVGDLVAERCLEETQIAVQRVAQ
jgi:hypothetical protein